MTRIKVCGITTPAERDAAVAAGADAIGVVVDVPVDTHREVTYARAGTLLDGLPPFVTGVAVTMVTTKSAVNALCERVRPAVVQLHDPPAPATVRTIAASIDQPVMVAIDPSLTEARRYAGVADALLVDTRSADGGGGTGRTHDWTTTATLVNAVDRPVLLAGGLHPGNVGDAIEHVHPFGVDVSSGVEGSSGRKDPARLAAFARAVHHCTDHTSSREVSSA